MERVLGAALLAALSVLSAAPCALAGEPETPLADLAEFGRSLPGKSVFATFVIESWLEKEIAGGDYAAELARAYQERADEEAGFSGKGDANWLDATAFYAKSKRAFEGEEVAPWAPEELGLSDPELTMVYQATLRRAERHRRTAPDACAQMVALYDHWIEQRREGPRSAGSAERLFGYYSEAYKACGGEQPVRGFPIGACECTDDDRRLPDRPEAGRKELMKANALAQELGAAEASGLLARLDVSIRVEGRASASGGKAENERLARCRAEFVRKLLTSAGVSAARIAVQISLAPAGEKAEEAYDGRKVMVVEE